MQRMSLHKQPVTQGELDRLRAAKHCIHVYPRKRVVSIDGFPCRPLAAGAK